MTAILENLKSGKTIDHFTTRPKERRDRQHQATCEQRGELINNVNHTQRDILGEFGDN